MSLITCPECGARISDKASCCVQCGYPLQDVDKTPDLYCVKRIEDKWVLGKARSMLAQTYITNKNSSEYSDYSIIASGITKDRADILLDFIIKNRGEAEVVPDENSKSVNQKMMDYININFNKNAPIMCPRCKSTQILTGQRGFSLITGFIGSNKTVNRCSKCGYTWQPK